MAEARSLRNAQALQGLNDDRAELGRLLDIERSNRRDFEMLQARYDELAKRFSDVVAARDFLMLEKAELVGTIEGLQARHAHLAQQLTDAGAARDQLLLERSELANLRARFDELSQRFSAIVAARDYLDLQNAERAGVIDGLRARHDALLEQCSQLTEETERLKRDRIEQTARVLAADATADRLQQHEDIRDAALHAIEQSVGARVSGGDAAESVCFAVPMKDGREVVVRAPVAPFAQRPSSYFVAYAKAGSVLFDALVTEVAQAAGVPWMNLTGQLFDAGYTPYVAKFDLGKLFVPRGVVYIGFRNMPRFKLPLTPETPIGALVRDPRDMLVSAYYSQAKSHALPSSGPHRADIIANRERAQAQSIDDFCRARAKDYIEALNHNRASGMNAARIFRYEDIIYRKADLVRDICGLIGVTLPREEISAIARRHDVVPDSEQTGAHVRQVHPGNHRNKLKPETIEYLNEALKEFLDEYGYNEKPEGARATLAKTKRRPGATA